MRLNDGGQSRRMWISDVIRIKERLRYRTLIAALIIAILSVWATTQAALAGDQETPAVVPAPNGSSTETHDVPAAGSGQTGEQKLTPPDSLQSCCDWDAVTAFLSSGQGEGSRTMAQTLYVLSAQDALKAVNDALKAQKHHLSVSKTAAKKGGNLMSLGKSLRTSGADLQAEIEALTGESIPDKEELLKNMKNALGVVQQDLAIHERILDGKTATPVLLGKIAHLDRLLAQVTEDCRKYLTGGR